MCYLDAFDLTGVAAAKFTLPACVAWIVQVPAASSVTVVPDTEQTVEVVEAKCTVSPEEAVALTVNGESQRDCSVQVEIALILAHVPGEHRTTV